MRKMVFVVLVLSLTLCFWSYQIAVADYVDCPGGATYFIGVPVQRPDGYWKFRFTYYCCDGSTDVKENGAYGCLTGDCCTLYPALCGLHYFGPCATPSVCTSEISSEATETGCHYVVKNYNCDGNYIGQTEADSGPPPDGLSCCDAAPGDDAYCPEDQRVEYPTGSGNHYCKCGKVTWYDSEPWRQGLPGPPAPPIP